MSVHADAKVAGLRILRADQVFQSLIDDLVIFVALRRFVRFAGGEERQKPEGSRGDVVRFVAAILVRQVRTIEHPTAIGHLLADEPLEAARHCSFGRRRAAAFTQGIFTTLTAGAIEGALQRHAAGAIAAHFADSHAVAGAGERFEGTALSLAAEAAGRGQIYWSRRLVAVVDAGGLVWIDRTGDADFADSI